MTVRTRIAPSPTGDPHVGTAYIALFNYCFAKSQGGQFLMRIEDTDQVRSTRESERMILEALRWCGLEWDEGPDVGGPHEPYRQSERSHLYTEHADQLIEQGHAFRCFCTQEELAESRRERKERGEDFLGYAGTCLGLSDEEVQGKLDEGVEHVVRMKVPRDETIYIKDRLRGVIEFDTNEIDMQVLLKSDGLPTYHLANVVDDHHMEITHVIRGEEWLSSAPKHRILYDAFGWEMPEIIHMPLLRNDDKNKTKLSKRKNPTSIMFYKDMGIVPQALLNFLGLMGWSLPRQENEDPDERFDLETMVESFDIDRVSLGGPVFDTDKLEHLNGRWLREVLSEEEYAAAVRDWALNAEFMMPMISMIKKRANKFTELVDWLGFFFGEPPEFDPDVLLERSKNIDEMKELMKLLQFTLWRLEALSDWSAGAIGESLRDGCELYGLDRKKGFGSLMGPVYLLVTGETSGPPMFDSLALMGPDRARHRFRAALKRCGGVSNKKRKKWRKEFDRAWTELLVGRQAEGE